MSNATTPMTVGWTNEPDGRGTIGLIWSCLATIFLCSWGGVHLNVPPRHYSSRRVFWRRISHVILTLLLPEYMVIGALLELADVRRIRKKTPDWSIKKVFFMRMGGFRVADQSKEDSRPILLPCNAFITACQDGQIPWPETTDAEIDDHNKADVLVKVFTAVQVLWFVAQLVGRIIFKLTFTTIELFTLAMVVCGLAMNVCWWYKPFDVMTPIIVQALEPLNYADEGHVHLMTDDVPDDRVPIAASCLACLIFGGIHMIGWNFQFPSLVEQLLWRISSIGCTALPLLYMSFHAVLDWLDVEISVKTGDYILFYIFCPIYTLMRVYMMVEMFVSLRSVPADVYQTPKWSLYFPSFG